MLVSRRQLASSLCISSHIADREMIAAFILDEATEPSVNPFSQTSAGAQRHIWTRQCFEFRSAQITSLGLACLLNALGALHGDEPLVQEIFRSGPYRAYVYHHGDGCRIVGAVLHGRAQMALPDIKRLPRRRTSRRSSQIQAQQLDLFALAHHA